MGCFIMLQYYVTHIEWAKNSNKDAQESGPHIKIQRKCRNRKKVFNDAKFAKD